MHHQPAPQIPSYQLTRSQFFGPSATLRDAICAHLERGESLTNVCRYVGMTTATFKKWLNMGEAAMERARQTTSGVPAEERPYVSFTLEVAKALAADQSRLVALVEGHAEKDPKSAQWLLERKYPAEFSERHHVELTGEGGGPIEIMPAREFIRQRIEQTSERLRNGLRVVDVEPTPELPPAAEG